MMITAQSKSVIPFRPSDAIITVSDVIFNLARRKGYRLPKIAHVYENYIPERFIPEMLP